MGRHGNSEIALAEVLRFHRSHGSSSAELVDLRGGEIARGPAHGVKGAEDIAMVGVDAPELDGGVGGSVVEV